MSFYKELAERRGECFPQPSPEGLLNISDDVGLVALRMGEFKYGYVSPWFESILPGRVLRLPSEAEETKRWPGKPDLIAAEKAIVFEPNIRMIAIREGIEIGEEKLALSVGQDVQLCDRLGRPIHKPEPTLSKEDIFTAMKQGLGREQQRVFRLKSGVAVVGMNNAFPNKGVTLALENRFKVTQFSEEELELYIFGLAGQNGDYPPYLEEELRQLIGSGLIIEEEKEFYGQGLSLGELLQTSGGFRWPHPIFTRHINEIDGYQANEAGFDEKKIGLFMSLIGMAPESAPFLKEAATRIRNNKIDDNWQRLVVLRDGSLAEIRPIDLGSKDELERVSDLVKDNFQYHNHYQELSNDAKLEFIRCNSLEGIRQTCSHRKNLMTMVITRDNEPVGYCVARKDGGTVEIRRLHTKIGNNEGLGIATFLLEEAEALATSTDCLQIAVVASGGSAEFFSNRGYEHNGTTLNGKMKARGIQTDVTYCVKSIGGD